METTVEKKLEALEKLQAIDSKLDAIYKVRGDLPEEVKDLEDEMEGYKTRIKKISDEIANYESEIEQSKIGIKEAEQHIKKNEEQQMNVRNNREYEAISKEIESRQLDIKLFEKKMKELAFRIEGRKEDIAKIEITIGHRNEDLEAKNKELETIVDESQDDEAKLLKDREKAVKNVDDRLQYSYDRIRGRVRNGLAVVTVKRNACGGCFNMVPPQRQAEIKERKKLIVCEHCGRILANVELVIEDDKPKKRRTTRKRTAKNED